MSFVRAPSQLRRHTLNCLCYYESQRNDIQLRVSSPPKLSWVLPTRALSFTSSSSNKAAHGSPPTSDAMASSKYTNKKPALTHFLCLPLLTPYSVQQLRETLSNFKHSVSAPVVDEIPPREDNDIEASLPRLLIPDKAFRPLGVLHLTLGVMSLRSQEKINAAKVLLEDLDLAELLTQSEGQPESADKGSPNRINESRPAPEGKQSQFFEKGPGIVETLKRAVTPPLLKRPKTSTGPLIISLQGLQAFPKPQKATVLHCPPNDPTSRLYPFCLALRQKFLSAGLIQPEDRPLVLHATVVNTVYAKKDRRGEEKRMGSINFDATGVMRKYNEQGGSEDGEAIGAFVWADGIEIDRVRICEMGAKSVEDDVLGQEYKVLLEKMI